MLGRTEELNTKEPLIVTKPTYNLGDLIDKLSILTRKIYFGDEDSISEHRFLEQGLKSYGINGKLVTNVMRIMQINAEIWNLENEIRNGGESKFSPTEIGMRAIKIRDLNRKRIDYKNKLTDLHRHGYRENKVNHRSEK